MAGDHGSEALHAIRQQREDADRLLAALDAEAGLLDEPKLIQQVTRVREQASKLQKLAKDPITIGVVGEYSVGKSLLVGTLLGMPDLLPASHRPVTGNVTAIHLEPADVNAPTTANPRAEVLLMSREHLAQCVADILDALQAKMDAVTANDANHSACAALERIRDVNPVDSDDGWAPVESWCRRYLWPSEQSHGYLEPRKIAVELLAMRDAHLAGGDLLGKSLSVDRTLLNNVVDLGDTLGVPGAFPTRKSISGLTKGEITNEEAKLRVVFPLIKRVSLTVHVDQRIWSLSALRDQNTVVILDFPGLTANRSAERDAYLSRSELEHVQTIVTVYGANKAGNDVPQKFYSMLQSHGRDAQQLTDWILAVDNAFDRIPAPAGEVAGLAGLRKACSPFDQFYISAGDLVSRRFGRLRLVSSAVAIERCGYHSSPSDAEERDCLDKARRDAIPTADKWRDVAGKLVASGELAWGKVVDDFAADGGMDSLRKLIVEHVHAHGLRNKMVDLLRERRRLDTQIRHLKLLLGGRKLGGEESVEALQTLSRIFEELGEAHAQILGAAQDLRDPVQVEVRGQGLIEAARNRAAVSVHSWTLWRLLMQRLEHGLIPKNHRDDETDPTDNDGGWGPGFAPDLPRPLGPQSDTTAAFAAEYERTFVKLTGIGRADTTEAIFDWYLAQDERLRPLREELADPRIRQWLETGVARLRVDPRYDLDWIQTIDRITNLEIRAAGLRENREKDRRRAEQRAAATARETVPLQPDHALPWHADVPEAPNDFQAPLRRHQINLLRLRRELAVAMEYETTAWIAQDIASFRDDFIKRWKQGGTYLPREDHLLLMFEPDAESTDPSEDTPESPLQKLLRDWKYS